MTHRKYIVSHRLRAGPVNENKSDITPSLEYTSLPCESLLYQPKWIILLRTTSPNLESGVFVCVFAACYKVLPAAETRQLLCWLYCTDVCDKNNNSKGIWLAFPSYNNSLVSDSPREINTEGFLHRASFSFWLAVFAVWGILSQSVLCPGTHNTGVPPSNFPIRIITFRIEALLGRI